MGEGYVSLNHDLGHCHRTRMNLNEMREKKKVTAIQFDRHETPAYSWRRSWFSCQQECTNLGQFNSERANSRLNLICAFFLITEIRLSPFIVHGLSTENKLRRLIWLTGRMIVSWNSFLGSFNYALESLLRSDCISRAKRRRRQTKTKYLRLISDFPWNSVRTA